MPSNTRGAARLAVLIDAENVSPSYVGPLLSGVAGLGTAAARRMGRRISCLGLIIPTA